MKNIDVEVPRNRMTVITGVSGSGKSTLAFDVIFGEGQRRYLESLNAYARQFVQPASRPDVDGIYGIPPTVAIEQRTSRGGRKSTVATLTEIYHFLRLSRQARPAVLPRLPGEDRAAELTRSPRGSCATTAAVTSACSHRWSSRARASTPISRNGRRPGFHHLRVDGRFLPTDRFPRLDRYVEHDIELPVADLVVDAADEALLRTLRRALDLGKGIVMVAAPLDELRAAADRSDADGYAQASAAIATKLFSTRRACSSRHDSRARSADVLVQPKIGWCPSCLGTA